MTEALNNIDIQRDDVQNILDETSLTLRSTEKDRDVQQQEIHRCHSKMNVLEKRCTDIDALLSRKTIETSRLRSQMEQLIDEKTTTRGIQELKSSELHALRNDLRAMTMENQAVSNEASTSNQERNGLLARVETMQIRLTNALEEIETSTFFEKRGFNTLRISVIKSIIIVCTYIHRL